MQLRPILLIILLHLTLVEIVYRSDSKSGSELQRQLVYLKCPKTLSKTNDEWKKYLGKYRTNKRLEKCDIGIPTKKQMKNVSTAARLAFGITLHGDVGLLLTQMSLIFRPHHSYCFYIDKKAKRIVFQQVERMISCYRKKFPKTLMFRVKKPSKIFWGHVSLLRSDLTCMRLLLDYGPNWEYFLNLAGSELPQFNIERTEEIISEGLKGQSYAENRPMQLTFKHRIRYKMKLSKRRYVAHWGANLYQQMPVNTFKKKPFPPFKLSIFMGYKNVVLNRTFSRLALENPAAKSLYSWFFDTRVPDESFLQTLITMHFHPNGTFSHQDLLGDMSKINFCSRYTVWIYDKAGCHGQYKRDICNFGTLDLETVLEKSVADKMNRNCLFINKMSIETDATAIMCWKEHLESRNFSDTVTLVK